MTGCRWFNTWPFTVQGIESVMISVGVILDHFHRFEFFEPGFFGNFVFPRAVLFIFKVADICDIPHISHFIIHKF